MSADPPRYVVASAADATTALRRVARAGWKTREGFALTDPGWDVSATKLVLFGKVADADTAELALLAAARGAGVIIIADVATDVGRELLADLGRVGATYTDPESGLTDAPAAIASNAGPQLAPEQRALLDRLANGETIATAAQAEFLSLRTANRRIAEARGVLGVRTTREAVLAYLRMRREGDADQGL